MSIRGNGISMLNRDNITSACIPGRPGCYHDAIAVREYGRDIQLSRNVQAMVPAVTISGASSTIMTLTAPRRAQIAILTHWIPGKSRRTANGIEATVARIDGYNCQRSAIYDAGYVWILSNAAAQSAQTSTGQPTGILHLQYPKIPSQWSTRSPDRIGAAPDTPAAFFVEGTRL
jgi:hypothetical protein